MKKSELKNFQLSEKIENLTTKITILEKENTNYANDLIELEEKFTMNKKELDEMKISFSEKCSKFEKLKITSNESMEELIKTNNELSKLKSENKKFVEKLNSIDELMEVLSADGNSKDKQIRQMKLNEENLLSKFKSEKDKIENKYSYEKNNFVDKIEYLEKELNLNVEQNRNLTRENKSLSEKVRNFSDYKIIKNEAIKLQEGNEKLEQENVFLKSQNSNYHKQNDNLLKSLATEIQKGDQGRIEVNLFFIHFS